jgi:hypothetical protein
MKYLLISAGLLLCTGSVLTAQVNIKSRNLQDFAGNPLLISNASETLGSVFYDPAYKNAKIYLTNGVELTDIKVKLNLRDSKVYYLNNDGAEMEAVSKVKKIVFTDNGTTFQNGFPAVDKQDEQTYYKVLVAGKATLLVLTNFLEVEYKEFNSATTTKQIDRVNEVFGVSRRAITKLASEDDVMVLLADKYKQVYDYIYKNKLKCRKQADYINVVNYYNTLN